MEHLRNILAWIAKSDPSLEVRLGVWGEVGEGYYATIQRASTAYLFFGESARGSASIEEALGLLWQEIGWPDQRPATDCTVNILAAPLHQNIDVSGCSAYKTVMFIFDSDLGYFWLAQGAPSTSSPKRIEYWKTRLGAKKNFLRHIAQGKEGTKK